jgi:hypothetical protein
MNNGVVKRHENGLPVVTALGEEFADMQGLQYPIGRKGTQDLAAAVRGRAKAGLRQLT